LIGIRVLLYVFEQTGEPKGIGFATASRCVEQATFSCQISFPNLILERKRMPMVLGKPTVGFGNDVRK
jgi:hypothetical protein